MRRGCCRDCRVRKALAAAEKIEQPVETQFKLLDRWRRGEKLSLPQLSRALSLCRIRGAWLLAAKLDRLAHNVAFISTLMESGVDFEAVDLTQANKLTVHITAAMAEHEAGAISSCTKAALAAAKARGTKLGGYRWDIQTVTRKGNALSANTQLRNRTECPEGLQKFWMGHSDESMDELYDKIKEDVKFRRDWPERCGFGFKLPPVVPSVPNIPRKEEKA